MLNKLRIGHKLFLGFGIIIALLAVLTLVTANNYRSIGKSYSDIGKSYSDITESYSSIETSSKAVSGLFERSIKANDAIDGANMMRRHLLFYLVTDDPQYLDRFKEEAGKIEPGIRIINEQSSIEENRKLAGEILGHFAEAEKKKNAYVDREKDIEKLRENFDETEARMSETLKDIAKDIDKMADESVVEVDGKKLIDIALLKMVEEVEKCVIEIEEIVMTCDEFVVAKDETKRKKFAEETIEKMTKLVEHLEKTKLLPPKEFLPRFDKVIQDQAAWITVTKKYIDETNLLRKEWDPILAELRSIISKGGIILANVTKAIKNEEEKQKKIIADGNKVITNGTEVVNAGTRTVATGNIVSWVVSGLVFFIAVVMGFVLTKSVAGGIAGITKLFHAITAEGDVSVVIDEAHLRRGDEIGDLANQAKAVIADFQSVTEMGQTLAKGDWTHVIRPKGEKDVMNQNLKDMIEHINETLKDISQVAKGVATGAGEVTKAASSLSSGAQESAASLEQITASMSEVSGQVKKNAESAGEARDLANLASKAAVEGENAMQKMTDAMDRITQNSNEIQRVIKVIDDIAFQTNLLALNAAVEAARAGQHGKGFAVVAEEVRNLAARSAKAAHETSDLISKSSSEIKEGGEVATHTAEVLNTIVEQIKKTTDLVAGIAVACNEQAQGVGQITIGLQQIDAVTQQNTAAAEESASAANEMSSMATNLQDQVDQFKL